MPPCFPGPGLRDEIRLTLRRTFPGTALPLKPGETVRDTVIASPIRHPVSPSVPDPAILIVFTLGCVASEQLHQKKENEQKDGR